MQYLKKYPTIAFICLVSLLNAQTEVVNDINILHPTTSNIDSLLDLYMVQSSENISLYYEYDILYITETQGLWVLRSEVCDFPIGIFDKESIKFLMFWIIEYPPTNTHLQDHYQGLIKEKLWN